MSEADEQAAVVEYCALKHIPIYHIPNEGKRSKASGANLKRQGLKPGVPDLCIPVASGKYHSLYIEMKANTGRVTDNQQAWIGLLRSQGMCAYVCFGAKQAIDLIDKYLNL